MKNFFFKNYIHLIVLFLSLFFISCTQNSFVCWNEAKTEAIAFAYDDSLIYVNVDDIHSYSTLDSKKSLNSNMPGGTHKLEMNENMIVLEVIQDTVFTKTRLPSGNFIKNHTEIKTKHDYLNQRRYHAVYPVVLKYVFDKYSSKLAFSARPLPIPRSAIEQKFIYNKTTKKLYPEKTKDLTHEEFSTIFPAHENSYTNTYPNCEDDFNPFKRSIRTILKYFYFV